MIHRITTRITCSAGPCEALPHLRLAAAMKQDADYTEAVRRVEEWLGKSENA
jgi:hypothetical protein